jgi:hypothetical protein
MDAEDQKDIIKKVKEGGEKTEVDADVEEPTDNAEAEVDVKEPTETPEGEVSEIQIYEMENLFVEPKKNNMFQPGSNDILDEADRCTRIAKRKYDVWPSAYASGAVVKCRKGKIWKGIKEEDLSKLGDYKNMTDEQLDEAAKKTDFSKEKESGLHGWFSRRGGEGSQGWVDCNTCRDGKCKPCGRKEGEKRSKYPSCRPTPSGCKSKGKGESWGKKSTNESEYKVFENMEETNNYMFWLNLKGVYDDAIEILHMDKSAVDELIADGHQWALEHIVTSKDDIEEVYHFLEGNLESNNMTEGNMGESNNYMFWSSLKTIAHASGELLEMDKNMVDEILSDGNGWALDHIATSNDDIEEVYHFLANTLNAYDGDSDNGYEDEYGNVENANIYEGKYEGKPLGKPMKGDVKKFKVYVKNKKGNVIKVNFGDPNMEIKRDNPERRKSFRARHKCAQAKDRTTPKYWSCKMWSKKPVSKIVEDNENTKNQFSKDLQKDKDYLKFKEKDNEFGTPNVISNDPFIKKNKYTRVGKEKMNDDYSKINTKDLDNTKNKSTFDKIKSKIRETFNQEYMTSVEPQVAPEPQVKPQIAPKTEPAPTRRNKPFLPKPNVDPNPKAVSEGLHLGFGDAKPQIYHKTLSETLDTIRELVIHKGYDEIEFGINDIQHVAYGETVRIRKPLYINGVENKKWLNAQIYRMDNGTYELNVYIN